jgi:hypothetical protein
LYVEWGGGRATTPVRTDTVSMAPTHMVEDDGRFCAPFASGGQTDRPHLCDVVVNIQEIENVSCDTKAADS